IPYGIIVPRDVDGLLAPVAASTTHLAFSSIRLEPTWTAIAGAAGIAAHLAIEGNVHVSKVVIPKLQTMLLEKGQGLRYFKDLDPTDPSFHASEYLGTKGFFVDYNARSTEPLEFSQAVEWLKIAAPGLQLPPQSGGLLPRRAMQTLFPGAES